MNTSKKLKVQDLIKQGRNTKVKSYLYINITMNFVTNKLDMFRSRNM